MWWLSTVAVLYLIIGLFTRRYQLDAANSLLLSGYVLNLAPFIGISRVMFLYHYLSGLVFALLILAYIIERSKNSKVIFTSIAILAVISFVFFSPLSYGLELKPMDYVHRVWFESWQ
ncbi:MAG: hypothetical protein KW806_03175 [Candidatus Yanofskybacteria bacterium]|nr:hypothetical protein [Candidatus Yanofskybacteria bacterium]